jgi:hypothetical protein
MNIQLLEKFLELNELKMKNNRPSLTPYVGINVSFISNLTFIGKFVKKKKNIYR